MRGLRVVLLALTLATGLVLLGFAGDEKNEPLLTAMKMTFHQTTDDKDWDTQVRDYVACNGHTIAKLECCSSDRRDYPQGDHWRDPGDTEKPMTLIEHEVRRGQLNGCEVKLSSQAGPHGAGNDT